MYVCILLLLYKCVLATQFAAQRFRWIPRWYFHLPSVDVLFDGSTRRQLATEGA